MSYAKKRVYSSTFPSQTGTQMVRYSPYRRKKTPQKKKAVKYRYTNPQPWWNPKASPEMKAFDLWYLLGNEVVNYANVAYAEGGDGANVMPTGYCCFNRIRQGSTYANRVGAKVLMKHISVSFSMNHPTEYTTDADYNKLQFIRVLIIYDKNTNGAAPGVGDIFNDVGMGADNDDTLSFPDVIKLKSRFLFLRDQVINYATNEYCKNIKYEIDCSLPVTYSGLNTESPTIANIQTGGLYFLVYSNLKPANSKGWYLGLYHTRVYFQDQ